MEICDICGASEFRQEKVSETFTIGETAVTADNIAATVCAQCVDSAFSRETAEQLRKQLHSEIDAALVEMVSDPEDRAEAIQLEKAMNYPIVVYPCEEGGFVAEIPALTGCLAQGETIGETVEELQIVKTLWLETAQKQGRVLPDADRAIVHRMLTQIHEGRF